MRNMNKIGTMLFKHFASFFGIINPNRKRRKFAPFLFYLIIIADIFGRLL